MEFKHDTKIDCRKYWTHRRVADDQVINVPAFRRGPRETEFYIWADRIDTNYKCPAIVATLLCLPCASRKDGSRQRAILKRNFNLLTVIEVKKNSIRLNLS